MGRYRETGSDPVNRREVFGIVPGAALAVAPGLAAAQPTASASLSVEALRPLLDEGVPPRVEVLVCAGYDNPGDGGAATWRRVTAPPPHGGFVRDRGGAVFELAAAVVRPEMFGARGGDHDDGDAIRRAVMMAAMTARRAEFLQPRYTLSGEIPLPGDVSRFAIVGGAMTELIQLSDDCSIFHFVAGNTRNWTISDFRFAWRTDQTPAHRRSYAIRFDADASVQGAAGHWNFRVSNCLFVNGFRGVGQSDDGKSRPKCPVWGAALRDLRAGTKLSGAAIALRTWGRAGQPNNRIEQFYARCDAMSEPAIILEAMETAVLSSVEFNRGRGCQIQVEASANVALHAIRFEEVALAPGDCFIAGDGAATQLRIDGLSVQSILLENPNAASSMRTAAIVRFARGARGSLRAFTDNPWRSARASRDAASASRVAVVDCADGGCVLEMIGQLRDPALMLASADAGVAFADGDRYDLATGTPAGTTARQLVRRAGKIVTLAAVSHPPGATGVRLIRNGQTLMEGSLTATPHIVDRAWRRDEPRWDVAPGDVLEIAPTDGGPALVSVTMLPV